MQCSFNFTVWLSMEGEGCIPLSEIWSLHTCNFQNIWKHPKQYENVQEHVEHPIKRTRWRLFNQDVVARKLFDHFINILFQIVSGLVTPFLILRPTKVENMLIPARIMNYVSQMLGLVNLHKLKSDLQKVWIKTFPYFKFFRILNGRISDPQFILRCKTPQFG